jgi:hypothetical protein
MKHVKRTHAKKGGHTSSTRRKHHYPFRLVTGVHTNEEGATVFRRSPELDYRWGGGATPLGLGKWGESGISRALHVLLCLDSLLVRSGDYARHTTSQRRGRPLQSPPSPAQLAHRAACIREDWTALQDILEDFLDDLLESGGPELSEWWGSPGGQDGTERA